MTSSERVRKWLESGKQIGKRFEVEKEGEAYWTNVAIQKHEGVFKLYTSEIPESRYATPEDDLKEEIIEASSIERVAELVAEKTGFSLEDLAPLKGQRIFQL